MKTSRYLRRALSPFKWLVGSLMCVGLVASAGPIFPIPNPAVHPPGFAVHLAPVGPALLPPGAALPPLFFGDPLLSPDPHHWEVEVNNPNPFAMGFNVTFSTPGGPYGGGLFLPPGASMYFDVIYADVPDVVPPAFWSITAVSAPGMPGPVFLHTDVLEYPFPTGAVPGIGAMIPSGPGVVFGPAMPGPGIVLTIVPEPGTLTLLGLGALAMVCRRRWRV